MKYEGEVLTPEKASERYGAGEDGMPSVPPHYVLRAERPLRYIDASRTPEALARYINHANKDRANVRFTETGYIRTVRRIRPGTQLLANYGPEAVRMMRRHNLLPPARRKRRREDEDESTSSEPPASTGAEQSCP